MLALLEQWTVENLLFYEDVVHYKKLEQKHSKRIWERYLMDDTDFQVHVGLRLHCWKLHWWIGLLGWASSSLCVEFVCRACVWKVNLPACLQNSTRKQLERVFIVLIFLLLLFHRLLLFLTINIHRLLASVSLLRRALPSTRPIQKSLSSWNKTLSCPSWPQSTAMIC